MFMTNTSKIGTKNIGIQMKYWLVPTNNSIQAVPDLIAR